MPVPYDELRDYLDQDPDGIGTLDDSGNRKPTSELLVLLNTPDSRFVKRVGRVPMAQVLQWAGGGPMEATDQGQTHTNISVRSAAKTAMKMFGTVGEMDVDDPTNQQFFNMFVQAGVWTAAWRDALLALGDVPATPAEHQWGPGTDVTADDIARAN